MKITIKKVALLVVALAAVYCVVPMKALSKKELQAREHAVKEFLKRPDLSGKNASEFESLVSKLQGTMLAHKAQEYRSQFRANIAVDGLNEILKKMANGDSVTNDDIKKAATSVQQTLDELNESLSNMDEREDALIAQGSTIAALFLYAMYERPQLGMSQRDANKFRDDLRTVLNANDGVMKPEANFEFMHKGKKIQLGDTADNIMKDLQ